MPAPTASREGLLLGPRRVQHLSKDRGRGVDRGADQVPRDPQHRPSRSIRRGLALRSERHPFSVVLTSHGGEVRAVVRRSQAAQLGPDVRRRVGCDSAVVGVEHGRAAGDRPVSHARRARLDAALDMRAGCRRHPAAAGAARR